MKTPHVAMHDFLNSLELTDNQVDEASRQHRYLREQLQQRLFTQDNFLSGSYARSTAIRPLHDIDVFLVLDGRQYGGPHQERPETCLGLVQQTLDGMYPNKEHPILQARSVNLAFSGTGIAYDVVPAFQDPTNPDVYWVPDRERNTWIPSNPKVHKAASKEANERAGKMLKPLIKAAKHWNTLAGKPLRSFHLEVLAYDAITSKPDSWPSGLASLLSSVAERVVLPCPEPAGLGPRLDEGVDTRRAQEVLREAAAVASLARDAAAAGRDGEAHALLRRLLGDAYPEQGQAPGPAPAVITQVEPSPDSSRLRFG